MSIGQINSRVLTFARIIGRHLGCRRSDAVRVGIGVLAALGLALARLRIYEQEWVNMLFSKISISCIACIYLDRVLLHRQRPADAVQLIVQAARVAHRLALVGAAPQRRLRRVAIGAGESDASRCTLQSIRTNRAVSGYFGLA